MRSGDRCGGMLPLEKEDATTVARVLKGGSRFARVRSIGSTGRANAWRFVRVTTGSNVDRIVAGAGRVEERIAHTLTEAARPAVAGHLVAMAMVLSGFLGVGDLPAGPLTIARVALAAVFVYLVRRLGKRLRHIRVGLTPVSLPAQVSVLWLGLLPWGLAVWLAIPLLLGWIGVGLPYAVSGGLMALTLVSALVLSVRSVAAAQQASWRERVEAKSWTGTGWAEVGRFDAPGWDRYSHDPRSHREHVR